MNRPVRIAVKENRHSAAEEPASPAPHGREDDFEALRRAVMATAQGRWFLSEYLRREQNRQIGQLLKAVRKLARVVGQHAATGREEDATGNDVALNALRLLLAQTADDLARRLAETGALSEPEEATLPEAAASRMLLLLETIREAGRHGAGATMSARELAGTLEPMFTRLARLLGEQRPAMSDSATLERTSAAPGNDHRNRVAQDTTSGAMPGESAATADTAPTVPRESTATEPRSVRRKTPDTVEETPRQPGKARRRIVIRRKNASAQVNIPLPEQVDDGKGESEKHEDTPRTRGLVRIR